MLPNVFIAGAQKSGTTTLCYALDQHPDAIVSKPKEPAFFSRAAGPGRSEDYEHYFQAKAGHIPRAVIDGSNAYMVDPLVPSRIRKMLGDDLRFVFCLREPVARTISGYWHQAKKGRERRPLLEALFFKSNTLDAAVREENERLQYAAAHGLVDLADSVERFDDPLWNFRYLRNSLYAGDLARFRATFGAARVKVVLFEELVREPITILSLVAAFLNLDPVRFPANLDLHRNATALMRAPTLVSRLQRLPGRHLLRRTPGYEQVRRALVYRRPPRTDPAVTAQLLHLFAPEVARLEGLLSRDLAAIWGRTH
jgi:hypothetical protein